HRDQSLKPQRDQELEKTTLACGRAFQMKNGNFRFVGINIGDTMLIAYNPQTRKFETIAKARQIIRGFGNGSPAALPDLCTEEQMITFDVTLPKGTIVFGLTDGVWDYLPIVQNSQKNQRSTGIINTEIDFKTLMADPDFILPEKVTVSRLSKVIADYSVKQTDLERIHRLDKAKEAKESELKLSSELQLLQNQGKKVQDEAVYTKRNQLDDILKAQKVTVGDDYTLVGLLLSEDIDLTPDYTLGEIAASILTLGLYSLIKDCLHIGTDDEITLADGLGAAAATIGFFATGSLLGLGYLAYKGIRELSTSNEEIPETLTI
ncbi:MAG: hypothetical protein H0T84_09815, partial [Tatlockia sp.]|nr:hypothetical protein [Tatlockia sp.]